MSVVYSYSVSSSYLYQYNLTEGFSHIHFLYQSNIKGKFESVFDSNSAFRQEKRSHTYKKFFEMLECSRDCINFANANAFMGFADILDSAFSLF